MHIWAVIDEIVALAGLPREQADELRKVLREQWEHPRDTPAWRALVKEGAS